jgi:hypothetical protein
MVYYCTYDIMFYMSKYDKRMQARLMRKKGISIVVISRKLEVSKSSVSTWCNDIQLSEKQNKILEKNKGISVKTGQRMGAEANKRKKLNTIKEAEDFGRKMVRNISDRELMLVASALYWSEGSKSDATSTLMFVNSDPEMILVMKKFLVEVFGVSQADIVCGIQINRIHEKRIKKVLIFWKKMLGLKSNQIRKPYYINTKANKVYENYSNYYGVCRLFVRKGKYQKYRMLGLIKSMKENILSA